MLEVFLNAKPLYYDEIDYSRMPRVYNKIKHLLKLPKIIHIIGTNGKGTTGRFLATALYNLGFKTAHYTSPHILNFNERIWLNGSNANDSLLQKSHLELQDILDDADSDALSYFEYTTLLAMLVYKDCEFVILEAGLGGEYDATAVFEKELTLVTPIDIDHEAFLGTTINEIASTKLNAMQKSIILGKQKFSEVFNRAKEIASTKGSAVYSSDEFLDDEDRRKIKQITKNLSLADYLVDNLHLSISALKFLKIKYNVDSFKNSKLFGRLSKINENILLDVGHNPLAASSIAEALRGKKYILIYNSFKDKDYKKILNILKPIIKRVEIISINDARIESKELMQKTLQDLELEYTSFKNIDVNEKYLVFGSFSVAEEFLKVFKIYE